MPYDNSMRKDLTKAYDNPRSMKKKKKKKTSATNQGGGSIGNGASTA